MISKNKTIKWGKSTLIGLCFNPTENICRHTTGGEEWAAREGGNGTRGGERKRRRITQLDNK